MNVLSRAEEPVERQRVSDAREYAPVGPSRNPSELVEQVARADDSGLPSRKVDVHFFRACYPDEATLSDAEILKIFVGRESTARLANPEELFNYAQRKKLLPSDFDSVGYIAGNRDLWSIAPDWHAALHYVQKGRAENRDYRLAFEPPFYRELYFANSPWAPDRALEANWRESAGARFGSLAEALIRNGLQSDAWIANFDHLSYIRYNRLGDEVFNRTQALVHFMTLGIDQLLALDANRGFDPEFWIAFCGISDAYAAPFLYRKWVQLGRLTEFPANEAEFLRGIGLDLPAVPAGFAWHEYLGRYPNSASIGRNKWQAFEHFIRAGILEPLPLPLDDDCASDVMRAAADRFAVRNEMPQANKVFDRMLPRAIADPVYLQHAGDHRLRNGDYGHALVLYRQVTRHGKADIWTHLNAARSALECGLLDEARSWIATGTELKRRSRRLQELALQHAERRYQLIMARYISEMRRDPAEAREKLVPELRSVYEDFLSFARANFGQQEAAPRPLKPGAVLRVAMLANMDLPQCTHYRVTQKQEQLQDRTVDLSVFRVGETDAFMSAAATADMALFYRVAAFPDVLRCLAHCEFLGIPKLYDIDDLVFDAEQFPEDLAAYSGSITEEQHFELQCGVPLVDFAMRLCNFGMASTARLAGHVASRVQSGGVLTHRNALSRSLHELYAGSARPARALSPDENAPIVVFYGSGTKAHGQDFHRLLEPALHEIMKEDPRVRFRTSEFVDTRGLESAFPQRIEKFPFTPDRDQYLSLLEDADINVSILASNEFNHCKSEIKWLEAAAFEVPSLVSDVAAYRETLLPGKNVVVCRPDPRDWLAKLRTLIRRPDLRRAIGAAARTKAAAHYAPHRCGAALEAGLRRFAESWAGAAKPAARVRRRRILLVNVFFPPQSIGGATRVVADQARIMAAEHADEFEVAVFCANSEDVAPYRLECYRWHGMDVFSVGTQFREHMDWFARDEQVEPLFARVLDRFAPDLIHFHAVQRLGVGLLAQAAARRIPYVVTVHDGWWISDHQFLFDGLNRVRLPGEREDYGTVANPHSMGESRARRLKLASALGGAAAVYAVSHPFAKIYRNAGVANVEAVPNGVPVLPAFEPSAPPAGKVRIGHIGGNAYHKGFVWLRDTLSRGSYPHLELLAVGHEMEIGTNRRERWGATEVRWIGRVPLERAGWLYGQFEVLVAPSLWPESFGLVVREALAYRRWVVASDIGALGEEIVAGENGMLIDPADADSLGAALAAIDADPERFRAPPERAVVQRSVSEQVAELCQRYARILGGAAVTEIRSKPARKRRQTEAA